MLRLLFGHTLLFIDALPFRAPRERCLLPSKFHFQARADFTFVICMSSPAEFSDDDSICGEAAGLRAQVSDVDMSDAESIVGDAAVRCKRPARPGRGAHSAQDGPSTLAELNDTHDRMVGSIWEQPLLRARMLRAINRRIAMYTDYSGSGCAEQGGLYIRHSIQSRQPDVGHFFKMVRATDCDSLCSYVLRGHLPGPEKPDCVFDNLCDRIDLETLSHLKSIQDRWRWRHEQIINACHIEHAARSPDLKAAVKQAEDDCGRGVLRNFMDVMNAFKFIQGRKAFCSVHDTMCSLERPEFDGHIKLVVGGNSCLSWTAMGKQEGWFGDGSIAFIVWMYEIRATKPDWVIQECTVRFDHAIVEQILGEFYDVQWVMVCPRDLGLPCSRPRKWTVSVLKSKWRPTMALQSKEFKQLFHRKLKLNGEVFFQAPAAELVEFARELIGTSDHNSIIDESNVHLVDWKALVSSSSWSRWEQYLEEAAKEKYADKDALIANIYQNCGDQGFTSMMQEIPTLLRFTSFLVLIRSRSGKVLRPMTSNEHLASMGWPIWNPTACALQPVLHKLTSQQKKALAGNGMNIFVVALFQLWCMCCTEPVE
jgi:hypothetical protein